ncbi:hypothetical protein Ocin01_18726 [Orchesella cincta]|uniref:Uncharacterized protein n=1 Tax=Orchesella cincta TaxID=48709 RepID=A0A1D2M4P8_ORCCI|nr:hypothetical protein Ocin01_18726 [Orchesella cincta]
MAAVTYPKFARGDCSLGDVFLSLIFHCGLWIPAPVWDILTQYFGIGPVDPPPKAAGSRLSKVTFAVPEAITKLFDVSPASPPSRPEDRDNMSPLPPRRVTRSSPKDLYTLPSLISVPAPEDFTAPPPSGPESGARQRRSQARKQGSQTRRKRLNFNNGNGDESDVAVIAPSSAIQTTPSLPPQLADC